MAVTLASWVICFLGKSISCWGYVFGRFQFPAHGTGDGKADGCG